MMFPTINDLPAGTRGLRWTASAGY
jgi:hypothetical protein